MMRRAMRLLRAARPRARRAGPVRRASAGSGRGYTIIEVMMAIAVLAVGVSGIIAMQKVAAVGNQQAKNLAIANQLARTWLERLRVDAVAWNHPSSPIDPLDDLGDTRWLKKIEDGTGTDWFRPTDEGAAGAPTFDALGGDVPDGDPQFDTRGVFCTNVRLRWLYGPTGAPPYLIRAEVRIFWLREGGGGAVGGKPLCDKGVSPADVTTATANYHFVYATSAIAQNMAAPVTP